MSREIHVHVDLEGETHLVGRLWVHAAKGRESTSFEYDSKWLASPVKFAIDPALPLGVGSNHSQADRALFGVFGDSAPDRWGRTLLKRQERLQARQENRGERTLLQTDYLLMVNDATRQGALRFFDPTSMTYLSSGQSFSVPPTLALGKLLDSSWRISASKEKDQDVRDLIAPGSSLGGARPKASVLDPAGALYIAKFPSSQDEWDVPLWEYLSLKIARRAGLSVPSFRLEKVAGKNVLLVGRFDRKGQNRVPFISAMSMLEASDGDQRSYLEIAEILNVHGARPQLDKAELWRRMVFNIMVSNVDDHLRNHGFLYDKAGWKLSPVYDLEPTPVTVKPRILHTYITLDDGTASLDQALEVASEFGLSAAKAQSIAKSIGQASRAWMTEAKLLKAPKNEIEAMSSAFEHDDLRKALKLRAPALEH